MFSRKTSSIPWPLIIFGAIACGIIMAIGFVFFVLIRQIHHRGPWSPSLAREERAGAAVVTMYQTDLVTLAREVRSATGRSELFDMAEQRLLFLRVPAELMDAHLKALIHLGGLKENMTLSLAAAQDDLVRVLRELLDKTSTL